MNEKLLKLYNDWQVLYALIYHDRNFPPDEDRLEECKFVILILNTFNLMIHNSYQKATTTEAVNNKLIQLGNTVRKFYRLHHITVIDGNKLPHT